MTQEQSMLSLSRRRSFNRQFRSLLHSPRKVFSLVAAMAIVSTTGLGLIATLTVVNQSTDERSQASSPSEGFLYFDPGAMSVQPSRSYAHPVRIVSGRELGAVSFGVTFNPQHISDAWFEPTYSGRQVYAVKQQVFNISPTESHTIFLVTAVDGQLGLMGYSIGNIIFITKATLPQETKIDFISNTNLYPGINQAVVFGSPGTGQLMTLQPQNSLRATTTEPTNTPLPDPPEPTNTPLPDPPEPTNTPLPDPPEPTNTPTLPTPTTEVAVFQCPVFSVHTALNTTAPLNLENVELTRFTKDAPTSQIITKWARVVTANTNSVECASNLIATLYTPSSFLNRVIGIRNINVPDRPVCIINPATTKSYQVQMLYRLQSGQVLNCPSSNSFTVSVP